MRVLQPGCPSCGATHAQKTYPCPAAPFPNRSTQDIDGVSFSVSVDRISPDGPEQTFQAGVESFSEGVYLGSFDWGRLKDDGQFTTCASFSDISVPPNSGVIVMTFTVDDTCAAGNDLVTCTDVGPYDPAMM